MLLDEGEIEEKYKALGFTEKKMYDDAKDGKFSNKKEEPETKKEEIKPIEKEKPKSNKASYISYKWVILNGIFYILFYVFPLFILPNLILNSNKDYLVFTGLYSTAEGGKRSELPTLKSITSNLKILGPTIGGTLSRIIFSVYYRLVGSMFERLFIDHTYQTYVGIRGAYIVSLMFV